MLENTLYEAKPYVFGLIGIAAATQGNAGTAIFGTLLILLSALIVVLRINYREDHKVSRTAEKRKSIKVTSQKGYVTR
jgi:hypothetical protein